MKKTSMLISLVVSFILISGNAFASSEIETCKKIKKLFISGEFRKYSIPFRQPESDSLEYEFDLDKNGKNDVVKAYCGHGLDAVCEMMLLMNEQENFEFSLPATIRFMEIEKKIYIANGLTIDIKNNIRITNYTVHQLFPQKIKLICNKF